MCDSALVGTALPRTKTICLPSGDRLGMVARVPAGPATLSAVTALKGALIGAFVLGAAASLPAALARAATVNELLFNLPVSLYRQRVGGAAGS